MDKPPPLDRYQIILLGDRGPRVCTTCPRLLAESGTAEPHVGRQSTNTAVTVTATVGGVA